MKLKALRTSALLSLLFLAVYGACNWVTSLRSDVGTLYFGWERNIPFVPWMIIPYMSIDLFFIAAPFLCENDQELRVLATRITFVILVAGAFFLLFPLRFAFERPAVHGWLGGVFDAFRGMDKPFNLTPSLHIALRTILANIYARHTRGAWRVTLKLWFVLIGFSTVLTYQHHVLDVAGGFILAAYAIFLFPQNRKKLSVLPNRRLGAYYACGSVLLLAVTWKFRSWALLMLWPSAAMAIVACAYYGAGPGIYRKSAGTLPWSAKLALAPTLFGQYLSLLHYRRQCRPWDEVTPQIWIGRVLSSAEAAQAIERGVTAVLDLTVEFDEAKPFLTLCYLNVPILDLTAPTQNQLQEMANFIETQSATGCVYVHCKIGYSRSAAAVCAYLLRRGAAADVNAAVEKLRSIRPSIVVRPEIMSTLQIWQGACNTPRTSERGRGLGNLNSAE